MFIIGMASFIVTSTMCAFAQSPQTLIITRVFQGIAAALMYPQALSIIQVTFTSKERNIALALFGANVGIAAIAGQILGGFLVQINLFNFDWRLIFLVNVPIGIGTLIAASRMVHESKSEKPVRIDIGGAAILSVILFLLLYPLIEGRNAGWPLWMYAAIILSIILIFPFVLFERKLSISEHNDNIKSKESQYASKLPLMPLSLFKDRGFVIGMSIVLVFFIGSPVFIFILSFYLQDGLGFSPLTSGLTFLPMGIGILITSLITPKIVPIRCQYFEDWCPCDHNRFWILDCNDSSTMEYRTALVTVATLSVHNRNGPRSCNCAFDKYHSFTCQRSKRYRGGLGHFNYYDSNWNFDRYCSYRFYFLWYGWYQL